MTWQPMATRGRQTKMTARDWFDCALVVLAVIVIAYLVGKYVPVPQ